MPNYTFDLTDHPSTEDAKIISGGLDQFNASMGAPVKWTPLAIFIRDRENKILGGLTGGTYWGWLYIGMFWLSEGLRGQGMGSKILAQAEEEARNRGCHHAFLDTTSFQALPFYQKNGYQQYAQLDDFPLGHSRYYMKKSLSL